MKLAGHTNSITALEVVEIEDSLTAKFKVIIISSAKDGLIKLWDLQYEQSIETISSDHSEVLSMTYVRDERLLIIGTNSETIIFKRI